MVPVPSIDDEGFADPLFEFLRQEPRQDVVAGWRKRHGDLAFSAPFAWPSRSSLHSGKMKGSSCLFLPSLLVSPGRPAWLDFCVIGLRFTMTGAPRVTQPSAPAAQASGTGRAQLGLHFLTASYEPVITGPVCAFDAAVARAVSRMTGRIRSTTAHQGLETRLGRGRQMFAVFKTGGKQYRAEDVIKVGKV